MSSAGSAGKRFVAAVEAIYDAAPDPSHWPRALQAITDVFEDVGAILIWQRDDGGFGTIVSPGLVAAQKDYEENRWYLQDLPAQRLIARGYLLRDDTVVDHDGITEEEIATHPYYTDFCARHGIRWHMGVAVAPDPHIRVWMALQRAPHKPQYSQAERQIGAQLGRHVEKSLRLSIRLLDAELANLGLGDALMRLGIGVFALDSLGRVVFSNPVAQRLLGAQIEIVGGRLRLASSEARSAIEEILRASPAELVSDPKPILLHRAAPERPLVVYVLPVTPRESMAERFLTHTRSMVLVIEPKPNDPPDPAVVRDVFGVTLGEARVAALIAAGFPPRQVSQQLGISEETARTVLKRVYGKVGVSRQSELTALLGRLAIGAAQR
jgi:DNA-binding CsgD family transcriptional regulator